MINRRKLVIALGASALAVPFSAFAQRQDKVGRIGFLSPFPTANDPQFEAFKQQLRDLGHVEGKTIIICQQKGNTVGFRPLPLNWSEATWTSS